MVARPAVYECLDRAIAAREARSVGPAEPDPVAGDRETLRRHGELAEQPVTYGAAWFCGGCGEPAPCPTVRELAARYGCDVHG